jgi:hypothetical protein
VSVNAGPTALTGYNSANQLYADIKLCVPGTSTCQVLNYVVVDTGSSGLRVVGSQLSLALPQLGNGLDNYAECMQFLDGYSWGSVRSADIYIAGKQAPGVPIQVIGDTAIPGVPGPCARTGTPGQTVADIGGYAILGISSLVQDCGPTCVTSPTVGLYYTCSNVSCSQATIPLASQVANPVASFGSDNNGTLIQLPSVPAGGAPSVSGSLIFGIGTAANNGLGSAKVYSIDPSLLTFTTRFNSASYNGFLDTGSTGYFFVDGSLSPCTFSVGYYCPSGTTALNATVQAVSGGNEVAISFSVANADQLSSSYSAFNDLGGSISPETYFDWGMPFFFGRSVFTAIEGADTPGGTGPYFAF